MARLKIKLGDSEFEAEGTPEDIKAQYDAFLAAHQQAGARPPSPARPDAENRRVYQVDDTLMRRIFEVRQDGTVTLKALPKGDNRDMDAFLLLLLGYLRLKDTEPVMATHLLRAAQYSGLNSLRPADAASATEAYIIRGGVKKGTTYALNNQGKTKAEEIAATLFD